VLDVINIDVFYGDLQVLNDVSFNIEEKEIFSIIGANGMGKSTVLMTISGILRPRNGRMEFKGNVISRLSSDRIVEMGISQVPEGRQLFPNMNVKENLETGSHFARSKRSREETMQWIFGLFPILERRQQQQAGTLSGGEQQMLTIGRSLMSKPSLLLLDEPSLGLSPLMVDNIYRIVQEINQNGTTILMVEQNVRRSLRISQRACVLENGRIVMRGQCNELIDNPHIRTAYLGM